MSRTVPPEYFIEQYQRVIDPWHYETSAYERDKYEATLAALPGATYEQALELACSIGAFTNMLASRCRSLLAVDCSAEALERARRNCAAHAHVRFEQCRLPGQYPAGTFDLTTVCEFAFYLCESDLLALRENVLQHSRHGAHVILVHWTPPVDGHATIAQDVHEAFRASPLQHLNGYDAPTYRLDVFQVP